MRQLAAAVIALIAVTFASAAAEEEVAVLKTPFGEIVWRFLPEAAPNHVAYVKDLIRRGFYDGTTFHRVIPDYVAQGGDPNTKNADRSDDGEGEGDRRLKAEFSPALHYRPGTVGMARDSDPDSGSCQFFIALVNLPRLDGKYTIFGEVVSGLDVARKITLVPRDVNDNPLQRVTVTARLERRTVPAELVSRGAGESGETLTGTARPRWFDPKDVQWTAPVPRFAVTGAATGDRSRDPSPVAGGAAAPRLEVAIDETGRVIDARFPRADTPDAAAWLDRARGWTFEPAKRAGVPQKVRFEIDGNGRAIGPSTGVGAPLEAGTGVEAARPTARVDLAAGQAKPPKEPRLRLTVGADGRVTDASLQVSCGDPALDRAAEDAARRMTFAPATRKGYRGEPEPVASYVDAGATFVGP